MFRYIQAIREVSHAEKLCLKGLRFPIFVVEINQKARESHFDLGGSVKNNEEKR